MALHALNPTHEESVLPVEILSALERMHRDNPAALAAFVGWIVNPRPFQSVTLRFNDGHLVLAERNESAK